MGFFRGNVHQIHIIFTRSYLFGASTGSPRFLTPDLGRPKEMPWSTFDPGRKMRLNDRGFWGLRWSRRGFRFVMGIPKILVNYNIYNDLTGIMVFIREIIPFYGRKIQVSELFQFTQKNG